MSESISLFEDKFSRIHIDKDPSRRKKLYPKNLLPRENARNLGSILDQQPHNSVKLPPLPQLPISKKKNTDSPNKRMVSNEIGEASKNSQQRTPINNEKSIGQFSFMKETTSSSKKKLFPTTRGTGVSSVLLPPASPAPSAPAPNSATKKRLEYSRQLSQTLRSKRLISSGSTGGTKNQPTDITNMVYPSPEQLQETGTDIDESPTKQRSTRNASQPLPISRNNSENVFNRLYQSSSNSSNNLEHRMKQQQKNHRQIHDQSQQYLTHEKPNTRMHNSQSVSAKLSQPPLSLKTSQKYPSYGQLPISQPASRTPPLPDNKIDSIKQLYSILYSRDRNLLGSAESDSGEDVLMEPYQASEISNLPLNIYEKGEIVRKRELYFVPTKVSRQIDVKNYKNNFGFDDANGNYIILLNDHINYRYEILKVLGNGSFGNVVKSRDYKYKNTKIVALKVIKNDLDWSLQSINEIKMLKLLNDKEGPGKKYILKYFDHFNFRSHMCITTELLSVNIYSMIELTNFKGFSLGLIRDFSVQMLRGLQYIHSHRIIHCDIKPENIMLQLPADPNDMTLLVKIIDFGSSCFVNETAYTYIQSRYYRAPEVLLGALYGEKIDVWSIGCVITEMFSGTPLIPGKNEIEQIGLILELFGAPKSTSIVRQRDILTKSKQKRNILANEVGVVNDKQGIKKTFLFKLFDIQGKINLSTLNYYHNNSTFNSTTPASFKKYFKSNSKSLELHLNLNKVNTESSRAFLQFLNRIFVWDPSERASVTQLLDEPFFNHMN